MSHHLFQLKLPISSTTLSLFLHPNPIIGICSVLQYPTKSRSTLSSALQMSTEIIYSKFEIEYLLIMKLPSLDENQLRHIIRGSAIYIQTSQTITSNRAINSTHLPNS